MEPSSIELKVISCEGLKFSKLFQKPCVYAVGSIIIDGERKKKKKKKTQQQQQRQKTPVCRKGEGSPEWNHEMRFDLDRAVEIDRTFLEFNLVCEGLFSDTIIGEVRVPVRDLTNQLDGKVRFERYQVTSTDGKPNGVFYFSFKVNGKEEIQSEFLPYPVVSPSPDVSFPATAPPQPVADHVGFYGYPSPLQPAVGHVSYYQPPPPPVEHFSYYYPPPPPPVYFTGPDPYGFRAVGCDYAMYGMDGYFAVVQSQPFDYDRTDSRILDAS